jgi:hypothetical protein
MWHLREECETCDNKTCHVPVKVESREWYGHMLDELSDTINHFQSMAMEVVRDCWWNVGETITRMRDFYEKENINTDNVVQLVARDLKQRHPDRGMSKRTFQYALAFYRKFPDKDKVPQKSWKLIIEQDLTEKKQIEQAEEDKIQCPACGTMVRKDKLE